MVGNNLSVRNNKFAFEKFISSFSNLDNGFVKVKVSFLKIKFLEKMQWFSNNI